MPAAFLITDEDKAEPIKEFLIAVQQAMLLGRPALVFQALCLQYMTLITILEAH